MLCDITKRNKRKGFTLVEMLVSIGIFSVVLTVTLGAIVTIADSNKKARSLMSVMGNLNFAVDGITRSAKTGTGMSVSASGDCMSTDQVDYDAADPLDPDSRQLVTYCWRMTGEQGRITKQVEGGAELALTSPDVDIDYLEFEQFGIVSGDQPRLLIKMEGTVRVSQRVSSNFTIQTSVSQRQLNI